MSEIEANRRNVLYGIAAVGAAPLLAACGSDGGDDVTGSSPDTSGSTPGGTASSDAPAGGGIKTADIPVGSGEILKDENIVITQPTAGEFKAFSATCTHQGCQVSSVSEDGIACSCHGSSFSLEDGSVLDGPANAPLAEKSVTVAGDSLTVS